MQGKESAKSVHFSISGPPSEASSRAPSPAPTLSREPSYQNGAAHDLDAQSLKHRFFTDEVTPGLQGKDVYDSTLSWWRAGIRRKLVATVQWESRIIATMQVSYI